MRDVDFNYSDEELQYSGDLKGGLPHGKGLAKYQNGDQYEGEWRDGYEHGLGTYTWPGGRALIGIWNKGVEPDIGKWRWPDGREFGDKSEFIDSDLEALYREGFNLDKVLLDDGIDRLSLISAGNLSTFLVTKPERKKAIYNLLSERDSEGDFNDFVEHDPRVFFSGRVYTFNENADLVLVNPNDEVTDGSLRYWMKMGDGKYGKGQDLYYELPSGYDAGVLVLTGIHWNETFVVTKSGHAYHLETGFEDDGWYGW